MKYTIAIDWLAIHCHYMQPDEPSEKNTDGRKPHEKQWEPIENLDGGIFGTYAWKYKKAEYSTRQFSRLTFVSMPNPEGGWDDFAEVQSAPFSRILEENSVIIRFVNRALYIPDFWELANRFLSDNNFKFAGISRIDICADFNQFVTMPPVELIEGFAAKKYRHIGRGIGALYFNHGVMMDKLTRQKEYGVNYTGLSFGTHTSDCRVYLYNKSFELLTQGDKPWIRDTWNAIGLDVMNVWRLEVSIKSKGCKFKCKQSGKMVTIDTGRAANGDELHRIYMTFVTRLFAFVKNRRGIKNISREPRIQLFDLSTFIYQRAPIRNVSASNKVQRMIIKALYQLGDLYRGVSNIESADLAQSFSINIAQSTDLVDWMAKKVKEWERPTHL